MAQPAVPGYCKEAPMLRDTLRTCRSYRRFDESDRLDRKLLES